jgi:hypothetical protein
MSGTSEAIDLSRDAAEAGALLLAPDRRRHPRFPVVLFGRFMRESRHEYPCKLSDISVGGAALVSPVVPSLGERIIAYFDQLGGIEATAVRKFDDGFAVTFNITAHKREKLAAQITWLINRQTLGGPEDRRHERVALKDQSSVLKLARDIAVPCRVLDVSVSGASIETTARPEIGSEVMLGKMLARVVRHGDTGIGLEFGSLQDREMLRQQFG